MNSTQLRKYFDDQSIIVDYLETCFPKDRMFKANTVSDITAILAPPEPVVEDLSEEKLPKKKVTFLIPLGLPGMGKSTLSDRILKSYFSQFNYSEESINF